MKIKPLLFIFFIFLTHFTFASNKTIFISDENGNSGKKIELPQKDSLFSDSAFVQKNKPEMYPKEVKKSSLSREEKQWNFFMRTTLLILGTFIFIFVLFLVFRMKKK